MNMYVIKLVTFAVCLFGSGYVTAVSIHAPSAKEAADHEELRATLVDCIFKYEDAADFMSQCADQLEEAKTTYANLGYLEGKTECGHGSL